jgi:hypothetical protein
MLAVGSKDQQMSSYSAATQSSKDEQPEMSSYTAQLQSAAAMNSRNELPR